MRRQSKSLACAWWASDAARIGKRSLAPSIELIIGLLTGLFWCILAAWTASSIAASPAPPPSPLIPVSRSLAGDAQAAASEGKPLLLFFTQAGCSFCAQARRDYLRHLAVDPAFTTRATFREVPIEQTLPGFDGQPVAGLAVARTLGVRVYPTIVLVDIQGAALTAPLRGFSVPDFYAASIDSRITEAQQMLQKRK